MKTKTRILIPLLVCIILGCIAAGGWVWYDNNVDRSGWVEKDGIRFYQDFHADPVSGWLDLEDGRYHFHEDGTPYTGWQTIDEITYYFHEDGIMHTGWLEKGGSTYYFGGNGTMVVGWLWLEDGRYYLRDGLLLTGWQEIDGSTYYFNEDGIATLGFAEIDGNRYYFDDGIMATGYLEINGLSYYFRKDGTMFSGWEETDEGLRYYLPDGSMATGWQQVEDKRLYFNDDGLMHTGWLQLGEYRYFLRDDGTPATGPTQIDGKTHYFTPKGIEVMLVNAITPIPANYQQEIVNVTGYHDVDSRCYDALVQMLADCEAAGIEYTFNSAYRTREEQIAILEYRTLEYIRDLGMSFQEARAKALETVAIPDTSEHQLGLSVDLLGKEANEWLAAHCWDYGFILRYPENKQHITGITNEPWHFRYVGTEVSLDMKDSGLCLEEYLGAPAVTHDTPEAEAWYREEFHTITAETIAQYTDQIFVTYAVSVQ